jgi:hypothetical protein
MHCVPCAHWKRHGRSHRSCDCCDRRPVCTAGLNEEWSRGRRSVCLFLFSGHRCSNATRESRKCWGHKCEGVSRRLSAAVNRKDSGAEFREGRRKKKRELQLVCVCVCRWCCCSCPPTVASVYLVCHLHSCRCLCSLSLLLTSPFPFPHPLLHGPPSAVSRRTEHLAKRKVIGSGSPGYHLVPTPKTRRDSLLCR